MSKIKSILAFVALMLCGGAWATDLTGGEVDGSTLFTAGTPVTLNVTADTTITSTAALSTGKITLTGSGMLTITNPANLTGNTNGSCPEIDMTGYSGELIFDLDSSTNTSANKDGNATDFVIGGIKGGTIVKKGTSVMGLSRSGNALDGTTLRIEGGLVKANAKDAGGVLKDTTVVFAGGDIFNYGWFTTSGTFVLESNLNSAISIFCKNFTCTGTALIKRGTGTIQLNSGSGGGTVLDSIKVESGVLEFQGGVSGVLNAKQLIGGAGELKIAANKTVNVNEITEGQEAANVIGSGTLKVNNSVVGALNIGSSTTTELPISFEQFTAGEPVAFEMVTAKSGATIKLNHYDITLKTIFASADNTHPAWDGKIPASVLTGGKLDANGLRPYHWLKFDNTSNLGENSGYVALPESGNAPVSQKGITGGDTAANVYYWTNNAGLSFGDGDWTIVIVAKLSASNSGILWSDGSSGYGSNKGIEIMKASDGSGVAVTAFGTGSFDETKIAVSDASSAFHQYSLSYVKATKTYTLTVDGDSDKSKNFPSDFVAQNQYYQFSGRHAGGGTAGHDSVFEDFRIYHSALNNEQLDTLWASYRVARVGSTFYDTLADAIAATTVQNDEVELYQSVSTAVALSKNLKIKVPGKYSYVTMSGAISGGFSVTKTGSGTLTLSGGNSYTAGTEVVAGTLKMGNNAALGGERRSVVVHNGATLDLNNCNSNIMNITLDGGTLTSSDATIGYNSTMIGVMGLTKDSFVDIPDGKRHGIVTNGYNATKIDLAGHKLTKTGSGEFCLAKVTLTDGTLRIEQGTVRQFNGTPDRGANPGYNNDGQGNFSAAKVEIVGEGTKVVGNYTQTFKEIDLTEFKGSIAPFEKLTDSASTVYHFPSTLAEGTAVALATAELTATDRTASAYIGNELEKVNLDFDVDAKTVSYTLVNAASFNGKNYSTVAKAMAAASDVASKQNEQTVTLNANCSENINIPQYVIVDTSNFTVTGKISGSGVLIVDKQDGASRGTVSGNRTTGAAAWNLNGLNDAETWTGTIWLKNAYWTSFHFATLGNANSTVRLTNVAGYSYDSNNASAGFTGTLELVDAGSTAALTIDNAWNSTYFVNTLKGNGTFATSGTQTSAARYAFVDASAFTGSFNLNGNNKSVTIGDDLDAVNDYCTGNNILIQASGSATIDSRKTWSATTVTVNGTIKGSGTLGSATTFGDGATIDLTDGALTASGTVTFGNTLNVTGTNLAAETIVLTAANFTGNLPALSGDWALKYEDGAIKLANPAVKITRGENSYNFATIANALAAAQTLGSETITLEFHTTESFASDSDLISYMKAASSNVTFKFVGSGSTGVTLDFGEANATINSHVIFAGGTHTYKWKNDDRRWAAGGTYENPNLVVEDRTTLNFVGHDIAGYNGWNVNGVLRVKKGGTLNFSKYGTGTTYFTQVLALDPGSTMNVTSDMENSGFRMWGGADANMIVVAASAEGDSNADRTATINVDTTKFAIPDNGVGVLGVNVGANSILKIVGTVKSYGTAGRQINKRGPGNIVFTGTVEPLFNLIEGSATFEKVPSSFGTINGALAIVDTTATSIDMTTATLGETGTIDLSGCTALTTITIPDAGRDASANIPGITLPSQQLTQIRGYRETNEEYALGSFQVANASGMTIKVSRPGVAEMATAIVGEDGVAKLSDFGEIKIAGGATNFDLTFDGNARIDYTTVGGTVGNVGTLTYITNERDNTKGVSLLNRPWVNDAGSFFDANQLTLAMAGVMPASNNKIFMHIGNANSDLAGNPYYGVYLATGTKDNEVIIGWNEGNVGHEIDKMIVPNARSERHCYIITKNDVTVGDETTATFTIYLDGLKWKTFVPNRYFRITGGFQVGSCYGQLVSGFGNADGENSYVTFFRAYQRIITKAEIDAYAEAYPYTSPNGTYTRDVVENGNWVANDAWTSGLTTAEKPASSGNVVVTATHAEEAETTTKTITVNLEDAVEYEKLTLSGDPMTFTRASNTSKPIKSICTVIGTTVTLGEGAIDLTSGPTIMADGGKLKFDFSGLPASAVRAEHNGVMTERVTGEIDRLSDDKIALIAPTDGGIKSAELVYKQNHYEVVIRNRAAMIAGAPNQYFDTVEDAITEASAITDIRVLDDTNVLPEGHENYGIAADGSIVAAVAKAGGRGFVSLAAAAAYCEEGDVIELLANDTSTVALNKDITIKVSGATVEKTVSGVISGNYSIKKVGEGMLRLGGANTFVGLNVNEGTVKGVAAATPSATPFGSLSGTITVAKDATLDICLATLGTDDVNNGNGYTIVSNGGTITKTSRNSDSAYSKIIKSLTLNADTKIAGETIGIGVKSSTVAGAIALNGHTLTVEMDMAWNADKGAGNFYLYNAAISGSGTIVMKKGKLLAHTVGSTATNVKLILDPAVALETHAGLTVKELEYKGLQNVSGSNSLSVSSKITVDANGALTLPTQVAPAATCEWVIKEGTTLSVSGNRTTRGVSGGGTLVVTGDTLTVNNKADGYAVDSTTIEITGGTFKLYNDISGAYTSDKKDPTIRNAKFVIGENGTLTNFGWINMVGTIEFESDYTTTVFGGSNPSFRGAPNIIKSGEGQVTISAGIATGAKFSSLTLKGGSLTLTADVAVDSLVSGVKHKTVAYNSATRTYSLVGRIATVDGVDCFTKEDLAAHPQGTLAILNSDRVTINGNQVLVDGEALSAVTVEEMVLSPTAEETPGLRISEICPKLTLWDENHRDAGWLEVVNNGTAYANLKDYNIARFNRGKEVKKVTEWTCGVDVWVAPGARAVIKTSEDYPNAGDKQITQYGADLNNALVLGAKINPKKYPVVVLAKGKTTIQKCVVPVDVPENKSVCYDGELKNGATVSYITTATKGTANDFTGAVAVGPQVTSLYGVADAPDPWIAFPKAQLNTNYEITLPVNPVYGLSEADDSPDRVAKVQLIYQIGFETPVTNETAMVKREAKDEKKGWLYTGTIPASALIEAGQVVKFAVKITDGAGNTWRSPSFNNPEDGFQWYGTIIEPTTGENSQTDGGITTFHLFVPSEWADGCGTAHTNANAPMNVDADKAGYPAGGVYAGIYDGDTGMYYDKVRIDLRGNTSGKFTKKAHGLKFAKAQPFTGKDSVSGKTIECRKSSLTAEFADPSFVRQELSFKVLNDNGSPAPFHYPVRLNLNGAFYQLAFHTERFSDELIEDFYGLDGKGYGYKNIGPFNPGLKPVSGGIEKKTPDDGVASDNGVLDAFCRKMEDCELISESHTQGDPTPTADSAFATEFSRNLTKVVTTDFDLPAWLNYIALSKITGETDDVWANLSGYYDVNGTGTWMPLAYDMNQSFGQWHKGDDPRYNFGTKCPANDDHHKAHPLYGGLHIMVHYSGGAPYSSSNDKTSATKPYKGNRCYEAIFQNAKYRRLYLRRLRTLMDAEFGSSTADQEHTPIYQRAKAMVERFSAVAAKDRAIWTNYKDNTDELWVFGDQETWTAKEGLEWMWTNYIEPRRTHLYVTHAAANHTADQIGYGETLCAGIPAAQSSIDDLKDNFAVVWDDAHQAVVLKNKNAEAVDVSGWAVAGRIAFVFPAGTVIDQGTEEEPGTLYITANRKHTVELFGIDINDQTIIGNGTLNDGVEAMVVRTDKGLRILGDATDQETSIRFESIYGNTTGDGDTGEWFTLKNIGSTADVNLEGMTICILKDDAKSTEADNHCHVNFTSKSKPGSLSSGASKKFEQSKFVDYGFGKIQNNKLIIKLYDKYGINYQTLAVTQKDYPIAYGKGAYLVADSIEASVAKGEWHQVYDAAVQGDLTLKDWTKDKDSFKAMSKDLTVLVNDKVTIDLQDPTFGNKASLKIEGATSVATIKGTATKTVAGPTVIKSKGSLVFEDGVYDLISTDDCIQADGNITINGGTFICHSTGNDGIDANQNIVINGGTIFAFTAANEAEEGADPQYSTGLDVNTGHTITINGGTVIATSLAKAALEAMTINGQTTKIVEVENVSGATKAIGDVIVTFPTMDPAPTAVLVSTPTLTEETEVTPANPDMVEIVAAVDGETPTPAVQATVPASWVADKEGDAKVAAAEAFVLGLAEPTEKPMVSSEQTTEANSIRIVDNVAPRFGTGVTVKRTLFVGTTPGEEAADNTIEETNGGFTVPLPKGSEPKVKYIKIKYSFK